MNTESKNCRLCNDCSNSFDIEDCKTLFGYNSCHNFEHHGNDNDIKERLILLYAENAKLTEQLKNAVVLPCKVGQKMTEIEKKEILEMAKMEEVVRKVLKERTDILRVEDLAEPTATALYEAGYRKQSETVKEFKDKIIVEFNKYTNWDDPYCYLYEPEQQNEMFIEHLNKIVEHFGVKED